MKHPTVNCILCDHHNICEVAQTIDRLNVIRPNDEDEFGIAMAMKCQFFSMEEQWWPYPEYVPNPNWTPHGAYCIVKTHTGSMSLQFYTPELFEGLVAQWRYFTKFPE